MLKIFVNTGREINCSSEVVSIVISLSNGISVPLLESLSGRVCNAEMVGRLDVNEVSSEVVVTDVGEAVDSEAVTDDV